MRALRDKRGIAAHDFPEAPADPVALDRGADLPGDREAEAGRGGGGPPARPQHEGLARTPGPLRGGEEVPPLSQPLHAAAAAAAAAYADSRFRPRARRAVST